MRYTRSLTAAFLLAPGASPGVLGAYMLKDNYTPSSFFSMFNFFTVSNKSLTAYIFSIADKRSFLGYRPYEWFCKVLKHLQSQNGEIR